MIDKTIRIEDQGSRIKVGCGARHAAGLTRSSAPRCALLDPDRTTSHSTRLPNNSSQVAGYRSSKGFSLVSAIFLLVVIAALGTFAVTLSTTQQQSAALDVLGSRAYQAARAGIEWGAYQVLPASAVVGGFAANCRAGAAPNPQIGALPNTLAGFTVNVQCGAASAVEGTNTVWVYNLTSTATQGTAATPDYVERVVSVTIAQ